MFGAGVAKVFVVTTRQYVVDGSQPPKWRVTGCAATRRGTKPIAFI